MLKKAQVEPELQAERIVFEPEPGLLEQLDAEKRCRIRVYALLELGGLCAVPAQLPNGLSVAVLGCIGVAGLGEEQVDFTLQVNWFRAPARRT